MGGWDWVVLLAVSHLRDRLHPDHDHPGVPDRPVDGPAARAAHGFGHINPRFRTPDVSTWTVAGIAIVWYLVVACSARTPCSTRSPRCRC